MAPQTTTLVATAAAMTLLTVTAARSKMRTVGQSADADANANVHPQTLVVAPREITVFSANTYLIPWFYVYKMVIEGDQYAVNSCKDQHARAELVSALAKSHDVVALQEIWGGASDVVQRGMEGTHDIVAQYSAWKGFFGTGFGADYLNTVVAHFRGNGGLWFGTRRASALKTIWSYHHTFVHNLGEEFMNKSASFTLVDTAAKWGEGTHLLIVNTHLHSPHPFDHTEDRCKQREEMLEILSTIGKRLMDEDIHVEWSKCGVLLLGDLNTAQCSKGDRTGVEITEEYHQTLKVFHARDLFLENDSFDETTKGKFTYDGEANPYVSEASRKDSSRMDYALALDSLDSGRVKLMKLKASRCEIVDSPQTLCSDHYPLSLNVYPA